MRLFLIVILNIFVFCGTSQAKRLSIDIDAALFNRDSVNYQWEMYYTLPDSVLNYVQKDDVYQGELKFKLTFTDSAGNNSFSEMWIIVHDVKNRVDIGKMNLTGLKSFNLQPGTYLVNIDISDKNDSTTMASAKLRIKTDKTNWPHLSDIQLAREVSPTATSEIKWNPSFIKSGYYVVPNPELIYIGNKMPLKSYIEIYNTKSMVEGDITLTYAILDAGKREIVRVPTEISPVSDIMIHLNEANISVLPTGVYYLQAELKYNNSGETQTMSSFKKFYVLNKEIPPELNIPFTENLSFETSEFATMTEEQISREFAMASCIASSNEIELYKELFLTEAKQKFMYRFWKLRDTDTSTAVNERLRDYKELVKYTNKFFCYGMMKDGWKTDRGRVYLQYGKPTQIDRNSREGTLRAYETWFYGEIQGGISFVFVDVNGFGNPILVHSTSMSEIWDGNWFRNYVETDDAEKHQMYEEDYK
ncbi:MAG: GWxTD domain-containing protein [Candidatus Kapabacteria bacterium]|jgi:GWxTD domain-containing protein|nr:GWxTD domain-containing protein [Candidatus Kapabacteria bacterium]